MSMNPGATMRPAASMRCLALAPSSRPMAAMRPPRMPMSAAYQGAPVPSITWPCSMITSYGGGSRSRAEEPGGERAARLASRRPSKGPRQLGRRGQVERPRHLGRSLQICDTLYASYDRCTPRMIKGGYRNALVRRPRRFLLCLHFVNNRRTLNNLRLLLREPRVWPE